MSSQYERNVNRFGEDAAELMAIINWSKAPFTPDEAPSGYFNANAA
jgi:hypothetical protein